MSEIVVVYELDQPSAAHAPGRTVRVHAAPASLGRPSAPGPRTYCGRDTFAMAPAPRRAAEDPGVPWYAPESAELVCASCDAAVGND
ncbi:hypothetical protein AB0953_22105 [Streptomyces sp. NPDC046866]|uniref:hypothetical protein n=1 Tax=Streptomyces sp. NPDC046866 TaxID=3154921 RepID=UPI0034522D07